MNNNQMIELEKKEYILLQNNKLMKFIKLSNIPKIIKCIKNGADVNFNFSSPLKEAILYNNIDVINLLLDSGSIIHSDKANVLKFAITSGNLDIANFLIKKGADINKDNLIHHFIENKNDKVVMFLVEQGANISINNYSVLSKTIEVGNFKMIKYLIDKGAKLEEEDKSGPLITAIKRELILEESKDIEEYIKKDASELTMHTLRIMAKYHLNYKYIRNKCIDENGNEINILNYLIETQKINISQLENNKVLIIPEEFKQELIKKILYKNLEEELINKNLNDKKMKL